MNTVMAWTNDVSAARLQAIDLAELRGAIVPDHVPRRHDRRRALHAGHELPV